MSKQLELSESSESSTIESVNEEDEYEEDEDYPNEMSEGSGEDVKVDTLTYGIPNTGFAEISRPLELSQPLEVSQNVENLLVPQSPVSQSQLSGVPSMSNDRNDISTLVSSLDTLNNRITTLSQSPSSTDTNNILGGIVSIFKELPNGMDDEIANRLSEATGPDGKKLFESKEEAARFIAKMRALNSNRLSSIKGGGEKHAIQLNITNQVVSNMPRKPFIVDTHPIPYQY